MVNLWLDLLYKLIIGNERVLLDQVANQLKGCDLNFAVPSGEPENALTPATGGAHCHRSARRAGDDRLDQPRRAQWRTFSGDHAAGADRSGRMAVVVNKL